MLLVAGSVFWMSGEMLYMVTSIFAKSSGDFGSIKAQSVFHLLLASAAMIALYALGLFAAYRALF